MGQPMEKGLRTAMLASGLGRCLGLSQADLSDLYYLGLLIHVGCSATALEYELFTGGDDLGMRRRLVTVNSQPVAEIGLTVFTGVAEMAPPEMRDGHHERVDGSGYHRGLDAARLSRASRILAAADAYQAMTQARPHRPARAAGAAAKELRIEARAGRLDSRAAGATLEAAGHSARPARGTWPAGLSDREVDVLRLLCTGRTNKEMADALHISAKTVGRHVENIYGKSGVSTRPRPQCSPCSRESSGTSPIATVRWVGAPDPRLGMRSGGITLAVM